MPIPRTMVVDVETLAAMKASGRAAHSAAVAEPKRFADCPCVHRGESTSGKEPCSSCEQRGVWVSRATCNLLKVICTINGAEVNGTRTTKCFGCTYRSEGNDNG